MVGGTTNTDLQSVRLCNHCGEYRPIGEFRRRRRNSDELQRDCDACHREYSKRHRDLQRRRDLSEFMRRVQLTRTNPSKLEALTRAMVERFRGLEGFVEELMVWYRTAVAQNDIKSLGRFYSVVVQLIQASDQLASSRRPAPASLSDGELEQELVSQGKRTG